MISKKIINKFKNNYKITYNINTLINKYMKIKKQEREKFIYGDESLSVRRDNFEIKDSIRNGYI